MVAAFCCLGSPHILRLHRLQRTHIPECSGPQICVTRCYSTEAMNQDIGLPFDLRIAHPLPAISSFHMMLLLQAPLVDVVIRMIIRRCDLLILCLAEEGHRTLDKWLT